MKQVFTLGGRVEGLIPALVEAKMREKLKKQNDNKKIIDS